MLPAKKQRRLDCIVFAVMAAWFAQAGAPPPPRAIEATGVSAGLCVLVGGDGPQAVALCSGGRMLVHALALDEAACEPRQTIELDAAPVVSGLANAGDRLYATCEDGSLRSFAAGR
jgi:hypothetical protein